LDNSYNPDRLLRYIYQCNHGRAMINALRYAIEQADINNDVPYMVYFRTLLCWEADDYGDRLDIVTIFPEMLAVIDRYPVIEAIPYRMDNAMQEVLWAYETLLCVCGDFYQVSMKDCLEFTSDFERRWLATGHGERESDRMTAGLYVDFGNMEEAGKYISRMQKSPFNSYDCPGCCAFTEITYYLHNNEKEKADKIAEKVSNYSIVCTNSRDKALLLTKTEYMRYYIIHGDYGKAAEEAYILEHSGEDRRAFIHRAEFMCAYVHSKPGRGLRIYKKYWKEWQEERNMYIRYENFKSAACFFKGIEKDRCKDTRNMSAGTIKLALGNSFPLYSEDNIYNLEELSQYYYKEAENIADKFDKRNGTKRFIKELKEAFTNV